MTAACCVWPVTGRVEVRGAFPADPDLEERGRLDGVGRRYEQLHALGEISPQTYPGRSTPVVAFLRDLADDLQGETVIALGADRFRQSEVHDAMSDALLRWPLVWRGQGASATADGSADVRSFQRFVADRTITVVQGRMLMAHAISESAIRRDGSGNPALEKNRQRGRIDPLSAAGYRLRARRAAPRPHEPAAAEAQVCDRTVSAWAPGRGYVLGGRCSLATIRRASGAVFDTGRWRYTTLTVTVTITRSTTLWRGASAAISTITRARW